MPRGSATGFVAAFFSVAMGFALVWHIWWLAIIGLVGIVATGLVHAWRTVHDIEVIPEDTDLARLIGPSPP